MEPRSQSCFFIEDRALGYGLSIHYTVLNTGSGGKKDISFQLKDPKGKLVVFHVRKGRLSWKAESFEIIIKY